MTTRFKLSFDLVPSSLWGRNLRSSVHGLGPHRWKALRKRLLKDAGGSCAICGSSDRLQGHEVWKYEQAKTGDKATLVRVEFICWSCHAIAHWGNTVRLIMRGAVSHETHMALRRHFRRVNRCRQIDFDRRTKRALSIYQRRSEIKWDIDWGPYQGAVADAKFARARWKERQFNTKQPAEETHVDDYLGPGHHSPTRCPSCNAGNSLELVEEDTGEMSEGQASDYLAGMFGSSVCRECGHVIDWEV
jgi:Zn ribbon nucleic-acid-binding protein